MPSRSTNFNAIRASIRDGIMAKVLEAKGKVTLEAHRNVVIASPVDTGAFRGAWEVETPSTPAGDGRITNASEYAAALAEGHSPQAPAGWIENALIAATKEAK